MNTVRELIFTVNFLVGPLMDHPKRTGGWNRNGLPPSVIKTRTHTSVKFFLQL